MLCKLFNLRCLKLDECHIALNVHLRLSFKKKQGKIMATNSTRLTIDVPSKLHRELKSLAGALGVSLRELVINFLVQDMANPDRLDYKIPNEETIRILKETQKGKNIEGPYKFEDACKKLGL